jgi:hypothetical protein
MDHETEIWHIGRSWTGHDLEDRCPCPKAFRAPQTLEVP